MAVNKSLGVSFEHKHFWSRERNKSHDEDSAVPFSANAPSYSKWKPIYGKWVVYFFVATCLYNYSFALIIKLSFVKYHTQKRLTKRSNMNAIKDRWHNGAKSPHLYLLITLDYLLITFDINTCLFKLKKLVKLIPKTIVQNTQKWCYVLLLLKQCYLFTKRTEVITQGVVLRAVSNACFHHVPVWNIVNSTIVCSKKWNNAKKQPI